MNGIYARYSEQKNCIDVTVYKADIYIEAVLWKMGRWNKDNYEFTWEVGFSGE